MNNNYLWLEYAKHTLSKPQVHTTLKINYQNNLNRLKKLQLLLTKKNNLNQNLKEKLQYSRQQITKLTAIIHTEQKLRQQAELHRSEILSQIKNYKLLYQQEKNRRIILQLKLQQIVTRAREIMTYFLNSAFTEHSSNNRKAIQQTINNNLSEFDSIMLSKKSFFNHQSKQP